MSQIYGDLLNESYIFSKKDIYYNKDAFNKGDVTTDNILFECKTATTEKKSFSIKKEWLEKNKEEAFAMGKHYSVLVFNFGPDTDNYYVLDERTFKQFMEVMNDD